MIDFNHIIVSLRWFVCYQTRDIYNLNTHALLQYTPDVEVYGKRKNAPGRGSLK